MLPENDTPIDGELSEFIGQRSWFIFLTLNQPTKSSLFERRSMPMESGKEQLTVDCKKGNSKNYVLIIFTTTNDNYVNVEVRWSNNLQQQV